MPKKSTKMSGLQCLATENVWFDKQRYDDAEKCFYEGANGTVTKEREFNAILQDIAKSRQNILQSLNGSSSHGGGDQELVSRMKGMELENQTLHKVVEEMRAALQKLELRVASLEKSPAGVTCTKAAPVKAAPVKVENGDDDDSDIDLFGSDDDEEAERIKQERLDAYAAKKSKKPALIAKSSILLDVKPWDDETDMGKLEECVRSVQMDGLLWGASKLVPVGYGIKKLQINCVVEDDKVGTDILEEELTKFEDYIQSIDVAAFNKI
ncbi:eukaryotic translation elongation factor 1 delta a (guanine nucleotide exchange protein) isoform X1 [Pungitius pungitius]|uniref:eukaryotic translation elongation factor 1 delta a (guanine nucleotide exchange protein) isoform X1 n=1 Tax=Pungitius pungitius TaxID=134920 RepID=UPI001889303D